MKELKYDKVSEYGMLQKLWNDLHDELKCKSVFSMFTELEGVPYDPDNWQVKHPDILSDEPLVEGKVVIKSMDWDGNDVEAVNPTWRDVAKFFSYYNDGHHVFLEDLIWDGQTRTIEIISGS